MNKFLVSFAATSSRFVAGATVAIGVFALSIFALSATSVYANTPESCFEFDATNNTITGYTYTYEDGGNTTNCPGDVVIPAQIGGVDVKIIDTGAFDYSRSISGKFKITSVTFPEGLETVGGNAFRANAITTVSFPNSLRSIGNFSFAENNIGSVTLPQNPSQTLNLGVNAFSGNQIETIQFPEENLFVIENSVFKDNKLDSVTIPNTVTIIKYDAFKDNLLTEVVFEDNSSLEEIETGVFANNLLTEINLPDSLQKLSFNHAVHSHGAFRGNQIESIVIPSGVTELFERSFILQSNKPYSELYSLLGSDDEEDVQEALDSMFYTSVAYDGDADLSDGVFIGSGVVSAPTLGAGFNHGGHLINPTELTIKFHDENGDELMPDLKGVGQHSDGSTIEDYFVSSGPDLNSISSAVGIEELEKRYFHTGDTVTAPHIDGYVTPSSQTIDSDTITFTYSERPASKGGSRSGGYAPGYGPDTTERAPEVPTTDGGADLTFEFDGKSYNLATITEAEKADLLTQLRMKLLALMLELAEMLQGQLAQT